MRLLVRWVFCAGKAADLRSDHLRIGKECGSDGLYPIQTRFVCRSQGK